ncbi:hypothetical protein V2G26_003736 [Clonostachys chloroleuca]
MSTIDHLVEDLENISASTFPNEHERVRLRDALSKALAKIQTPWETIWNHNWENPVTQSCVRSLNYAGVFTHWAKDDSPKSCAELAALTGADEVLLRRMMHQIAGHHLVIEVSKNVYVPTPWARELGANEELSNIYGTFFREINGPMFLSLPLHLKTTGFRNPTDGDDCNWQFLKGPGTSFFGDIDTDAELRKAFGDTMKSHSHNNLTPWTEIYPTKTILESAKDDGPLVVDIGGSRGHDLIKFLQCHPDAAGRLVLQDLPNILHNLTLEGIILQPCDFFESQPTKGACVYFMHNVMHDWDGEQAITLLTNISNAMEKGYSKLLIHESMLSDEKPAARVATSDITMMACLASQERTETDFSDLLQSVGLRVSKIWRGDLVAESIIEAVLEDD